MSDSQKLIILFDGVCNLCNGFVNFLIEEDPNEYFKFASLQSDFGQYILQKNNFQSIDLQSVIVLEKNVVLVKSKAVFQILSYLPRWRWLGVFRFLPTAFLDSIYNIIARNRYRIFGKQDTCLIPTPKLRGRFLS